MAKSQSATDRISLHVTPSEVPLLSCPVAAVKVLSVKANPRLADRRVTFQHPWVLQVFTRKGVRKEPGLTPVALHICAGPREKRSKVNHELENSVCKGLLDTSRDLVQCALTHIILVLGYISALESQIQVTVNFKLSQFVLEMGVSLPVGSEYKDQNHVSLVVPPLFLILHVDRNMDLSDYLHVPD